MADVMEEKKADLQRRSAELSCATRIINLLMRISSDMNPEEVVLLESALIPTVVDYSTQVLSVNYLRSVLKLPDDASSCGRAQTTC